MTIGGCWACLGAFIVPGVWLHSAPFPRLSRRPERPVRLTNGATALAVLVLACDFAIITVGDQVHPTMKVHAQAADSVMIVTILVGRSVARLAPTALITVSWIAALITTLTACSIYNWRIWGRLFR